MNISEQISSNVRYLVKTKHLNIGDVERELGLSAGYFSRKVDGSKMPVQVAFNAANLLGISLDELCTDFRYASLKKEAAEMGYRLVPMEPTIKECTNESVTIQQ